MIFFRALVAVAAAGTLSHAVPASAAPPRYCAATAPVVYTDVSDGRRIVVEPSDVWGGDSLDMYVRSVRRRDTVEDVGRQQVGETPPVIVVSDGLTSTAATLTDCEALPPPPIDAWRLVEVIVDQHHLPDRSTVTDAAVDILGQIVTVPPPGETVTVTVTAPVGVTVGPRIDRGSIRCDIPAVPVSGSIRCTATGWRTSTASVEVRRVVVWWPGVAVGAAGAALLMLRRRT